MYDEYDFINRYSKEEVYTRYSHVVDKSKEYNKITRKQMLLSIYEALIADTSRFDGYLSAEALRFLIDLSQNKNMINLESISEYKLIQELQDCFLLSFYGVQDGFRVPQKIKHIIKDLKITKKHEDLDVIYDFLKGILLVRGSIAMDELESIYLSCKPLDINISLHDALSNLSRIFIHMNESAYLYDNHIELIGFHQSMVFTDYKPNYTYTWDTYLSVGRYGLNLFNSILNEFYQKLGEHPDEIDIDRFIEDFVYMSQIGSEFNMRYALETFLVVEPNIDKAITLYNEIVREIPRWQYKGDPISLVDHDQIKNAHEQNQVDGDSENELCPCGSGLSIHECCENPQTLIHHYAILDVNRAQLFYGLYYVLLHRTNQKYRLFPHFTNVEKFFERLSQPSFVKLADTFFESQDIIRDYIKQYEKELKTPHLEIINGFRHAYKKTFIALRYEDQKLILLDDQAKRIYVLSGIVSAIAINIPSIDLPQFVETRIIPLSDMIIYDVFINRIPITIGTNLRKEFKKVEKQSKIVRNIQDYLSY